MIGGFRGYIVPEPGRVQVAASSFLPRFDFGKNFFSALHLILGKKRHQI